MVEGLPVTVTHAQKDVEECIVKCNGVITHMAYSLGLSKVTLYSYLSDKPDLWQLIEKHRKEGRKYMKAWICDRAETIIQKVMEKVDDFPSVAFKASTYMLEHNDEYYGYAKKIEIREQELRKDFDKFMIMLQEQRDAGSIELDD